MNGAVSQITKPALCSSSFQYSLPDEYVEYKEKDTLVVWAQLPLQNVTLERLGLKEPVSLLVKVDEPWKIAFFEAIGVNASENMILMEINGKKFVASKSDMNALDSDNLLSEAIILSDISPTMLSESSYSDGIIESPTNLPAHFGKILLSPEINQTTLVSGPRILHKKLKSDSDSKYSSESKRRNFERSIFRSVGY